MTSRAQSIPQRISIERYYASHLWRGHSKKAVFAVVLLVVASLATSLVLLPYIFPGEPGIQLDMRFVLQSNSTADVFSTNCSWSAYRVEHDVYGTHIRWLEEYSELVVETEGLSQMPSLNLVLYTSPGMRYTSMEMTHGRFR